MITPSSQSTYLNGQANYYPTVMLDLDGNERASIGLRNNTFNTLHIFLDQLLRRTLPPETRAAAIDAFIVELSRVRNEWLKDVADLAGDLTQLDERIAEAARPSCSPKRRSGNGPKKRSHRNSTAPPCARHA
ncbi:MAG: hypothetical protein WDO18_00335 [Acidobacteriota bacterium]